MAKICRETEVSRPEQKHCDTNAGYMPARLTEEIERPDDGQSDEVTPALMELLIADKLRDSEVWAPLCGQKNEPASLAVDRWLASESFRLAMTISSLAGNIESATRATHRSVEAFLGIDELVRDFPECSDRIEQISGTLLSACYEVVKSCVLADHARQNSTIRPLAKVNAAASAAIAPSIDRARTLASEMWQADTDQEYSITAMAKEVLDILKREGFKSLPQIERIKEWIRPVAPSHASKPGRRRRSP